MTFYELSIVATLSATFAVACVYLFLFSLYRQTYICLWAVFWLVHFVTQILYRTPLHLLSFIEQIALQLIITTNYALLVFATSKFLGRKMHKGWYYGAICISILSTIAIFLEAPFLAKALPPIVYVAFVYFWHGWMFMHLPNNKGWGNTAVSLAFIGLGIHTLDMPFLITVKWFAPWGFIISGTLRFIIALGILMLYLERTFRDLATKEKQYRLLADNAADTIYLCKLKPVPKVTYVSPSIVKLTGYNTSDFSESPELLFSLIHPSDALFIQELIQDPITTSATPIIMRFIRQDHTIIWVEQTTVPIFDENGVCMSFEGIIRDITARRELEHDVSRLDRLNTVGQMAANVAHEIRNPLTTVKGYLQLFQRKPSFANYQEQFNLLISELDRANLIIQEYLSLCKSKSRELKSSQLNQIIQDIYPLLKAAANATSKDVCYSAAPTPAVCLDEKEIRQLLLNLVRNGLEAMDPGGTITIRTYVENGDVVLSIQDQGKGIPQHILDNIGKPFLTTKENGTGLGLAVVYRIVSDHRATIQVDSGSRGTTFKVIFKTT
ncbi:PAS sensor protein [uncultured Sporomusa sp.]|uniref:histidine kinase n=1 Tax=uncultured Sporomusa sp. TaxID=307249 RepID=A0A212LYF1_9FIRM|nr:ATP-binding protein [uncultured Sporomusa sp.]SCM82551.1 PAS sensor protein [uncultured Sporomusa sp.]